MEKHDSLIGILVGVCLILFRRKFAERMFQNAKEGCGEGSLHKIERTEGILRKGVQIAITVTGAILIALNSFPYFFDPEKYQRYIVAAFGLLFVALLPTCIVQLLLLKLIFKEVKKYETMHLNVKDGCTLCDPVLRTLQRKANVKATVSFVLLYMVFVFLLYSMIEIALGN